MMEKDERRLCVCGNISLSFVNRIIFRDDRAREKSSHFIFRPILSDYMMSEEGW